MKSNKKFELVILAILIVCSISLWAYKIDLDKKNDRRWGSFTNQFYVNLLFLTEEIQSDTSVSIEMVNTYLDNLDRIYESGQTFLTYQLSNHYLSFDSLSGYLKGKQLDTRLQKLNKEFKQLLLNLNEDRSDGNVREGLKPKEFDQIVKVFLNRLYLEIE